MPRYGDARQLVSFQKIVPYRRLPRQGHIHGRSRLAEAFFSNGDPGSDCSGARMWRAPATAEAKQVYSGNTGKPRRRDKDEDW